jgi:hypothetical protein
MAGPVRPSRPDAHKEHQTGGAFSFEPYPDLRLRRRGAISRRTCPRAYALLPVSSALATMMDDPSPHSRRPMPHGAAHRDPERRGLAANEVARMELVSTITCPSCGYQSAETMPSDACRFFYECKGCGELLGPKAGDCCVFCSYGDVPWLDRRREGWRQSLSASEMFLERRRPP